MSNIPTWDKLNSWKDFRLQHWCQWFCFAVFLCWTCSVKNNNNKVRRQNIDYITNKSPTSPIIRLNKQDSYFGHNINSLWLVVLHIFHCHMCPLMLLSMLCSTGLFHWKATYFACGDNWFVALSGKLYSPPPPPPWVPIYCKSLLLSAHTHTRTHTHARACTHAQTLCLHQVCFS